MTVYQLKYDQVMQVSERIVHLKTNKKTTVWPQIIS